jgi:putative membrane protein
MATADAGPATFAREHPRVVTALLTVVGYVLLLGTLYVGIPIYPDISLATVNLLAHVIAAVNTLAVVLLALGWYWIRQGEVRKHRAAMSTAFALILVFLVLYLLKTGGGGRKDVVGDGLLQTAYLGMLAVHIFLSVVAVPVVLHALVLGLTHTPAELRRETPHRRVGRIAAGSWIVSLVLGVFAFVLLNYVLEYEFVPMLVGVGPV